MSKVKERQKISSEGVEDIAEDAEICKMPPYFSKEIFNVEGFSYLFPLFAG